MHYKAKHINIMAMLAWIAAVYHIVMPFTPLVDAYLQSKHRVEQQVMSHDDHAQHCSDQGTSGSMPEHHKGGSCPYCLLGSHFSLPQHFFVVPPQVETTTLLLIVLEFHSLLLAQKRFFVPVSRAPPIFSL